MHAKTDRDWEKFGKQDPYYGVLASDKYRRENLSDEAKQEFFRSGEKHVAHLLDIVESKLGHLPKFEQILDYGCGVGRLTLPLTRCAGAAVGMDVSESMLSEAKKNAEAATVRNVTFCLATDKTAWSQKYDLVHSFIVFQHIPPAVGWKIVKKLIAALQPGGVGVLHFNYRTPPEHKVKSALKRKVPGIAVISNLLRSRKFDYPEMQMNNYDLNILSCILLDFEIRDFYIENANQNGYYSINLYFTRPFTS